MVGNDKPFINSGYDNLPIGVCKERGILDTDHRLHGSRALVNAGKILLGSKPAVSLQDDCDIAWIWPAIFRHTVT